MKINNRICIAAVLLMTGLASAATSWNASDPNDVLKGYADWNKATNWTAGIPGVTDPKGVFSGNSALECRVTDTPPIVQDIAIGDNGSVIPGVNVVRVMNGGTLKATGGWTGVSYNTPGKLIVEEGGLCDFAGHLWISVSNTVDSHGDLVINGGTVQNGGSFNVGCALAPGTVSISKGGVLDMNRGEAVFIQPGSVMDIGFGTFVIGGDRTASCATYVGDGRLKGFGGAGTVVYDYNVSNSGKTTVKATDPMHRNPVYTTVLAGSRNLTWTNLAPVAPATDVWVDVWFGTDPNKLGANYTKVLSKGKNSTSVMVNAPLVTEPTTYYWQVDSYLKGNPAIVVYDANTVVEGLATPFNVTNDTPPSVVIDTPPTATWIDEPIQLEVTLTDDGNSAVTYLWTSDEPNAVFSPSVTVAEPTVAVDWHTAQFTVTVTVVDGFNPPASASVTHDCAVDACQASTAVLHLNNVHKGDAALDCKLNLTDFAAFARQWLANYSLTGPIPQ